MRRALIYSSLIIKLIKILISRKGISQLKIRARDYTLYLYLIVKDLKRAFKPLSYHNITTILEYRALMSSDLYSLYIIITALLRTLERETNNEKFIYSITRK